MALATITIIGNLAADPELRFTPQGKAVCNFTVMTSRSKKNDDGTWDNDIDTTPWRCTVWEKIAENVAETLTRGTGVIVTGRVKQTTYDDREGIKRYSMQVDVDTVAVDLKRHTATVKSAKRGFGEAGAEDPWASNASEEPPF